MNAITQQGDTLDILCLRYYGRTQGVVETVLAANPGLAEHGPVLPHGTTVNLPEVSVAATKETVNLWA
ncbi:tail protein X [Vagococcus sp. WN89Y]|uniref:tail protein X n=1 Tax=Vagococcus sp. WN89Y TaxID=3457258 RepID=UPI003FCD61B1